MIQQKRKYAAMVLEQPHLARAVRLLAPGSNRTYCSPSSRLIAGQLRRSRDSALLRKLANAYPPHIS
jgi:hypothetical protein